MFHLLGEFNFLFLITDDRDFRSQTCTNGLVFRECKHIKNQRKQVGTCIILVLKEVKCHAFLALQRNYFSRHCLDKARTRWNDFLFLITDDRDFRPQTCTNGLIFRECKLIKNIFEDVYSVFLPLYQSLSVNQLLHLYYLYTISDLSGHPLCSLK
jgi:hypothetical protein